MYLNLCFIIVLGLNTCSLGGTAQQLPLYESMQYIENPNKVLAYAHIGKNNGLFNDHHVNLPQLENSCSYPSLQTPFPCPLIPSYLNYARGNSESKLPVRELQNFSFHFTLIVLHPFHFY